jgi:ubiquitin C-terminal hydrolase
MDNNKPKGLKNLGLRCYMNSLLQCFYYIPELRKYFIENKDSFNDKQPVLKALAESINGIKNEINDYYEPNSLKEAIKKINRLFEDNKACDVKDLFINIIDALLNEFNINNSVYEINDENEINEDILGKTVQFRSYEKQLDKNIINELFSGHYITSTTCKEKTKKTTFYSFQNECFISFDLQRVYKNYKNNLTIDSCFKEYYKTKNSEYYCPQCQKAHLMESQEKLYKPPKILAIVLDRGRGKTFKEKFIFNSEILDLTQYIDQRNNQEEDYLYYLVAVSTHSGSSSISGHYTACCLADDKEYYYFSDTIVKKIKLSEIYENEPYLLFYRRTEKNMDNSNDNNQSKIIKYNDSNILNKNIDYISPKDNIKQYFDFLLKNNINNCDKYAID